MTLLKWALIAFVVSIIAGALGFSGVSSAAGGFAKILFFIFIAIAIVIVILAVAAGKMVC